MRIFFFHIILLLLLSGCQQQKVKKPVWVNASAVITLPGDSLLFSSGDRNWKASLQCFTQPIPLQVKEQEGGFTVQLRSAAGILEGPAQLIVQKGGQYFYYELFLANRETTPVPKDYRSPKTVNPDSSLQQQRMLHQIDANRNIVAADNRFFREEIITLAPRAGSFRAIADEPLTAYYVQAGSCVSIPVKAVYNKEKQIFTVTAGPLQDQYRNTVADGTLVAFLYSDGEQTHRMEAALLDGVATVFIPAAGKKYSLYARVNETISSTIILAP